MIAFYVILLLIKSSAIISFVACPLLLKPFKMLIDKINNSTLRIKPNPKLSQQGKNFSINSMVSLNPSMIRSGHPKSTTNLAANKISRCFWNACWTPRATSGLNCLNTALRMVCKNNAKQSDMTIIYAKGL